MTRKEVQMWVHPNFKRKIKVEAASVGGSVIKYTKKLAESEKKLEEEFKKNEKKFLFKI